MTFEIGLDVPGTELGVDLLFHYNADEHRLVGFGLSFGMSIGLSPVDLTTNRCNTRQTSLQLKYTSCTQDLRTYVTDSI